MNIVFFLYSLSVGGAERVTTCLANHWVSIGHNISIMTLCNTSDDFYGLDGRIERISLNQADESKGTIDAIVRNFRRISTLRKALKKAKPDVAIGMMASASSILALAARGTGIITLGSERIYPPGFPLGASWEFIRRITYARLTAVVAQTEVSAAWIQRHTGAKRVAVIPNPVSYPLENNAPRIEPPKGMNGDIRRKLLLAVGRLERQKGFDILIEAFAPVAAKFPEWTLAILGEGRERDHLQDLVECHRLGHAVTMPGSLGNIAEWYSSAEAFVMTSRLEGFPNALLEAMAYGLPVISVDCETGPRELIKDGVNGLLISQNDRDRLVAGLEKLLATEDLRRSLGMKATEVREIYSTMRIAARWESLFLELQDERNNV